MTASAAALLSACGMGGMGGSMNMGGMGMAPAVNGYAEGQSIHFMHTEASDGAVADMLTAMMGSLVLLVPELAQAPPAMLANVYVFANGMKGEGPFGFQADVFDSPPGTSGYRPLRALVKVTWNNAQAARLLTSAAAISTAVASGELTLQRPGVVINMPMLTWPGGGR
jgi:hypothetical protein